MKTTLTLNITTKELKAAAKYQDGIQDIISAIAKAFGKSTPATLSNMEKIKLSLGRSIDRSGEATINGVNLEWRYKANKKDGVDFSFTMDSDTDVVIEIFNMYIDIIGYYAPIVMSSITGITAAAALAEERKELAIERLGKLSK